MAFYIVRRDTVTKVANKKQLAAHFGISENRFALSKLEQHLSGSRRSYNGQEVYKTKKALEKAHECFKK